MFKFFSSLFHSGKKEDHEYTDFLINELEDLKSKSEKADEENKNKIEELQQKIRDDRNEIESLQKQLEEYKNKNENLLKNSSEIDSLNDRLNEYEDSYEAFSALMQKAKKEAEETILNARQEAEEKIQNANIEAEKIRNKAKAESEMYQKDAEEKLNKKVEERSMEYMLAKYKLMEYSNNLNKMQSKLIDTYNEFGELVRKLPLRMEDVFSDEPFELLAKRKEDETEQ